MKKIISLFSFLAFFLVLNNFAQAEIINVTVRWTPASCIASCIKTVESVFKNANYIAEVEIDPGTGQATLKWKPNAPFSYQSVKRPMQMAGIGIQYLRIKVRGKIKHDAQTVRLVSTGDNTTFVLLDIVVPNPSQYVELNNPQNRYLSPAQRQKLLQAESEGKLATIEGPLFEPHRTPPLPFLQLITEKMTFEEPERGP